jgi:hypothetical protein
MVHVPCSCRWGVDVGHKRVAANGIGLLEYMHMCQKRKNVPPREVPMTLQLAAEIWRHSRGCHNSSYRHVCSEAHAVCLASSSAI